MKAKVQVENYKNPDLWQWLETRGKGPGEQCGGEVDWTCPTREMVAPVKNCVHHSSRILFCTPISPPLPTCIGSTGKLGL